MHMSEPNLYGLSINKADSKHILHDITNHYPLPDNSIYSYQAEDVLEHIAFEKLVDTINEIYRILHEGGLLRICLPDYYSAYLVNSPMEILFSIRQEGEPLEQMVSKMQAMYGFRITQVFEICWKSQNLKR